MHKSNPNDRASGARRAYQEQTEIRTKATLAKMLTDGERISFYTVAAKANIARSTLYRNETLKNLVTQARDEYLLRSQSTSKLGALHDRIAELEAELLRTKNDCDSLRKSVHLHQRKEAVEYYLIRLDDFAA